MGLKSKESESTNDLVKNQTKALKGSERFHAAADIFKSNGQLTLSRRLRHQTILL